VLLDGGNRRTRRLYIRPVARILGPFFDPPGEQLDLAGRELLAACFGRHSLVVIARINPLDEGAFFGMAGNDCRVAAEISEGVVAQIKPQAVAAPFTLFGVGTMTFGALVRENRPNVPIEIDLRWTELGGSNLASQAQAKQQPSVENQSAHRRSGWKVRREWERRRIDYGPAAEGCL